MRRYGTMTRWVLAGLVLVALVGQIPSLSYAAGNIPIPAHGPVNEDTEPTERLDCSEEVGQALTLELRHYQFAPEVEGYYQATGVGVAGEPDYLVAFWWPNGPGGPRDSDSIKFYLDRDRDGLAESVVSFRELVARARSNWCNTYLVVVLGRTL